MLYKKCRKAGEVFLHFCVNGYHGDASGAMVHNAEVSATRPGPFDTAEEGRVLAPPGPRPGTAVPEPPELPELPEVVPASSGPR